MFWPQLCRVLVLVICLVSLASMSVDFRFNKDEWNEKTRDYWYSRIMWVIFAIFGSIEGIIRHTPFRYSLVFLIAASVITLKANLQKGKWGSGSN